MTASDGNTPTTDAIRQRIHRVGAAGKVGLPDPAAAPLGAAEEAAGTPPTAQERDVAADDGFTMSTGGPRRRTGFLWLMLAVMVALLLAAWWSLATR